MATLEYPPHFGFANQWSVLEQDVLWTIQFSYQPPNGVAFAVVTFVIDIDDLATMLGDFAKDFVTAVDQNLTASKIDVPTASPFVADDLSPARVQVIRVARMGMDGLLEGYWVNPQSVVQGKKTGRQPLIQAVFAVSVHLPVMMGLLHHVAENLSRLRTRLAQLPPGTL
ncbi:MAG: hypothetical protein JNJ80_24355 [Gemmatimonadetes bacterium]|nr:hypothetical protein [Gemmatimonadota bacterium]